MINREIWERKKQKYNLNWEKWEIWAIYKKKIMWKIIWFEKNNEIWEILEIIRYLRELMRDLTKINKKLIDLSDLRNVRFDF